MKNLGARDKRPNGGMPRLHAFCWWSVVLTAIFSAALFGAAVAGSIRSVSAMESLQASSTFLAASDRFRQQHRHDLRRVRPNNTDTTKVAGDLEASYSATAGADLDLVFVPRAAAGPTHRVLLLTSWIVTPTAIDDAMCQTEFNRGVLLFNSVAAMNSSVHLLILTNLPCYPRVFADAPQLRDVLTVVRIEPEGTLHAWDERWVRFELVLRFLRQQWCAAAAELCNPQKFSDSPPSTLAAFGLSAELQHSLEALVARLQWPHLSYSMLMDMGDTFLLQPPSQFFSRPPGNSADLFIASEVLQAFYSGFLVGRYRMCRTRMARVQDALMLNAGLVGGRTHAMEWLAGRVRRHLLAANATEGSICLRNGVDMVYVNLAVYDEAAAAGVTVSVGPPFAAINRAGDETLHVEYPLSLGWAGFEGLPWASRDAPVAVTRRPEGDWVNPETITRLAQQAVGAWADAALADPALAVWPDEARCRCGYRGALKPVDEAASGDVGKGGVEMLQYRVSVLSCERCVPYVAAHKMELRRHAG